MPQNKNAYQAPTGKYNTSINMLDADWLTALHRAIMDGPLSKVEGLLKIGANVEKKVEIDRLTMQIVGPDKDSVDVTQVLLSRKESLAVQTRLFLLWCEIKNYRVSIMTTSTANDT